MIHTEIFIRYYDEFFWGNTDGSSGPNSAYHLTPLLRQRLSTLFKTLRISSLLDAGCGDANLMKYLDLSGIHYLGLDCVPSMIAANQDHFCENTHMQFAVQDIIHTPLPAKDLILCRDVVHYLPNDLIWQLLNNIQQSGSKDLLITHNLYAPDSANTPTQLGIFRPVNLTQAPFSMLPPREVLMEDEYGKALALWSIQDLRMS